MVYIVDLLRRGEEHGNINTPIIRILTKHNLVNHIWISSDSCSIAFLNNYNESAVTKIRVTSSKKYIWITSTLLTLKILIMSNKNRVGIFFLSTTPLQNLLITLINIIQFNVVKNYVLLHGELSYLIRPQGIGRCLGKIFLMFLFKILPYSNTIQITLGYPVFNTLKNKYKIKSNLINLEQPTKTIGNFINAQINNRRLRIGSFGVHSRDKSSHLIYDLAKYLEEFPNQFEILTIGVASDDFIYDQHPMVKHYCKGSLNDSLIPRLPFIEEIKKLDLALFFYGDNPQYEMVASGAFIECLNLGIPFAALSSKYLIHYLDKYGEIGFVKNSLPEMAVELNNISNNHSIFAVYKQNLLTAQEDRTYEKFEYHLLKIFK